VSILNIEEEYIIIIIIIIGELIELYIEEWDDGGGQGW
jgi:hypothetical protein